MDYETKDYEIVDFKKGDFQDNYGNWYCSMALKGVSEPVTLATKDPTQFKDGDLLYGTINHATSQKGKQYLKFKRMKKEDAPAAPSSGWQPESPERQDSINRSVALNDAALVYQAQGVVAEQVLELADAFYAWLKGTPVQDSVIHDISDAPMNLDDIPF